MEQQQELEERLTFARIITPEVLGELDDEQLQANIDSGYNLVNHRGEEFCSDDVRVIHYWLGVYEDERDRRSAARR